MVKRSVVSAVCLLGVAAVFAGVLALRGHSESPLPVADSPMPVGTTARFVGIRHDNYAATGDLVSSIWMDRGQLVALQLGPFQIAPLKTLEAINVRILVYGDPSQAIRHNNILGLPLASPPATVSAFGFAITFHDAGGAPVCTVESKYASWGTLFNGRKSKEISLTGDVVMTRSDGVVLAAESATMDVGSREISAASGALGIEGSDKRVGAVSANCGVFPGGVLRG